MLVCWRGEVLASVAVEVLRSHNPRGAATVVRIIDHPKIRAAGIALAGALNTSGFVGLDFILQPDGSAHLLEMNPRATQLGHLRLPGALPG
jgi:D-alanine-D-alanine ligase-like ATP-grasp enzyme